MAANIEIISKEMIKPSSLTPPHLRTHKLFLLDQLAPPCYIPLILFYQFHHTPTSTKSHQLKQSLSKILTLYYPLAGRINRNLSVDCNDQGVEYIQALVHAKLSQLTTEPSMSELKNLLPKKAHEIRGEIPLAVQINFFDCGGIAIGACISHTVSDAKSFATFLNAWAATCKDHDAQIAPPSFGSASIPPLDLSRTGSFSPDEYISDQELTPKRIVFEKEKLVKLKELARSKSKNHTRVGIVSSLIFKTFIEMKSNHGNMSTGVQAVDLRSRTSEAIPENAFGNIFAQAAVPSMPGEDISLDNLVDKFNDAIKKLDGDYYFKTVKQGDDEELIKQLDQIGEFQKMKSKGICGFSSWCRFPFYEVDFGWEKPVWVCPGIMPIRNMTILMSSRCGEGIEAWTTIPENEEFDQLEQLRALT